MKEKIVCPECGDNSQEAEAPKTRKEAFQAALKFKCPKCGWKFRG